MAEPIASSTNLARLVAQGKIWSAELARRDIADINTRDSDVGTHLVVRLLKLPATTFGQLEVSKLASAQHQHDLTLIALPMGDIGPGWARPVRFVGQTTRDAPITTRVHLHNGAVCKLSHPISFRVGDKLGVLHFFNAFPDTKDLSQNNTQKKLVSGSALPNKSNEGTPREQAHDRQ